MIGGKPTDLLVNHSPTQCTTSLLLRDFGKLFPRSSRLVGLSRREEGPFGSAAGSLCLVQAPKGRDKGVAESWRAAAHGTRGHSFAPQVSSGRALARKAFALAPKAERKSAFLARTRRRRRKSGGKGDSRPEGENWGVMAGRYPPSSQPGYGGYGRPGAYPGYPPQQQAYPPQQQQQQQAYYYNGSGGYPPQQQAAYGNQRGPGNSAQYPPAQTNRRTNDVRQQLEQLQVSVHDAILASRLAARGPLFF